jgi:predicted phage terminase large subunit-like protein
VISSNGLPSVPRDLPSATEIERLLAEKSLADFIRLAWPVVEPATSFVPGWHIDAIAEHLEAVTRGQIRNLIISVPPRSSKSTVASVLWPVWVWLRRPATRFLCASYSLALAVRDAVRCRRLIESEWYQERWHDRFALTSDQNLKVRYENDQTGYRLSTSVAGGVTGEGGDVLLVDDAHNVSERESDAVRQAALDWWDQAFFNRVNDPTASARVIIGQRVHVADLIGHVLARGGFEHLCLPEEFEPERRCVTSLGWQDPRHDAGELLRPVRFGPPQVREAKATLGAFGYAAQHQQQPLPREGAMFKADWFRHIVEAVPEGARWVRYWDKAGTEGGGKHSCGVLMAHHQGLYYVADVVRGQWSSGKRNEIMCTVAASDKAKHGNVHVWVEQEPGSGGKESAETSIRELAGHVVHADRVTGAKDVRAEPLAAQAEAGNVRLVRAPWNGEFVDEVCAFPNGTMCDQVDAAAGAFNKLALGGGGQGTIVLHHQWEPPLSQNSPFQRVTGPAGGRWSWQMRQAGSDWARKDRRRGPQFPRDFGR